MSINCAHQLLDPRDLRYQVFGHGGAVGFVLGIDVLAAFGVEQMADGEKGAIDVARTVDKLEAFGLIGHGAPRRC
ncbi:hypothetical protein GFER_05290 [Geoalkalibacter ferrihydriticus DSM 17813]|uniref:Uncharacterized protein n=1 Tax=Geoalkalibacter ferrihydriticus DSM 17813 TaxID=1121915 RepID=A0A0C2DX25_9BACT|nr:hypothetical protein GFER_05290 [Geoalkalibacter ferrihydriticus DSM 17813]